MQGAVLSFVTIGNSAVENARCGTGANLFNQPSAFNATVKNAAALKKYRADAVFVIVCPGQWTRW